MMCVLNWISIRKHLRYRQELKRTFVIPVISSAIMGGLSRLLYDVLYKAMGEKGFAMPVSLMISVIVAVLIYFVVLLALRGLKERELRAFPKGDFLVRVAKKLHFRL